MAEPRSVAPNTARVQAISRARQFALDRGPEKRQTDVENSIASSGLRQRETPPRPIHGAGCQIGHERFGRDRRQTEGAGISPVVWAANSLRRFAMTVSKKPENTSTSSADSLVKAGSVELSEAALGQASGGAVFPSAPQFSALKIDLKLENKASDPNLLLPAVKPFG
jgi:hypothetical protein